jgi:hypothetical protein
MSQFVDAPDQRRRELAKIHIARKELGIPEDAYRALLSTIGRVQTSGALSSEGRKRVLAHLVAKGWKPKRGAASTYDAQLGLALKLFGLLKAKGVIECDNEQAAFRAMVNRLTQASDWRFCTKPQKTTVIESLKKWCTRVGIDVTAGAGNARR